MPLAAVLAGLMALAMSLEIAPLAYEPHLTVLTGTLVGPAYGFLASFVFNVLRMLLGDGSVTLLGLNTLILGLEAVLGCYAFRAVVGLLPRNPAGTGISAALATVAALVVSTVVFLLAAALGSIRLAELAEEHVLERIGTDSPEFGAFAATILFLGRLGWLIEASLVGTIVAFVRAVRPSLLPGPQADGAGARAPAPSTAASA